MFSRNIKFKDFNDNDCAVDFYFHLSKGDLIKMGINDKFQAHLQAILQAKDNVQIMNEFEGIIAMSVGVRSEDGREFRKTPEITSLLMSSPAYDELLVELCTNAQFAEKFVAELIPKQMVEELEKKLRENAGSNTKTVDVNMTEEPASPLVVETDDLPAWWKEGRRPNKKELMSMDKTEQAFAMRAIQSGSVK